MTRSAKYRLGALLAACVLLAAGQGFGGEVPNLNQTLLAVEAYYAGGQYPKDVAQVVEAARAYLLERTQRGGKEKLAMVLDIDDTSLSWLEPVREANFCLPALNGQVRAQKADLRPILPTVELFNLAGQKGVAVFFITGRPESLRRATVENLIKAGYRDWAGLYLWPPNARYDSAAPMKTAARKEITEKGYTIVLNMGDQESDLAGGYAEETFKLPNYIFYYP